MKIIDHAYKWNGPLGTRIGAPPYLIHHHEAGYGTAVKIHAAHKRNGWRGIAYHYLIQRDGTIHRGRPEWAMGGHCKDNHDSLGICCEGMLHKERMTKAQKQAARWLTRDIHKRYPKIKDKRHSDLNATACPGKYYAWSYITRPAPKHVPRRQYPALKRAMRAYASRSGIEVPGVNLLPVWGPGARKLAWRVTGRIHKIHPRVPQSQWPTQALADVLIPEKR